MIFNETKAIYLQIADYVCELILSNEWTENQRIMSVRELGEKLEVNPNTVLRSYDHLQQNGIVEIKRGIGYFTTDNAIEKCVNLRKSRFVSKTLPTIFLEMKLLNISIEELNELYKNFLNDKQNEKDN